MKPPPAEPLLWPLLLQLVLILLNAVFACVEIALVSLNEAKLEKHARDGNRNAKRLLPLIKRPERYFATIQVGITLAGFLGSAFAAQNFSDSILALLSGLPLPPLPPQALKTASLVLITLVLSFVTIVLGELVPKRLAMKNAERLAYFMSRFIVLIAVLFHPAVWLLNKAGNGILRLLGVDPEAAAASVTEEEIRLMVNEGSERGAIEESEKELINNVFELDDMTASDLMTHRLDTVLLFMKDDDEKWRQTITRNPYSYYPVCGDTIDDIAGVLSTRDYLLLDDHKRDNVMKKAVREAQFVPETMKADVLLKQMKASRNHFALVLDEYGGFTGIVNMRDLLSAIVGDIGGAEEAAAAPLIEKKGEGEWVVNGAAPLDKVSAALGVKLPDDEYATFAGFVTGLLGRIPEDGEQSEASFEGLAIKVLKSKDHRIESVRVHRSA